MASMFNIFIISTIFFAFCYFECMCIESISCKDESGQNVDWFYLYKLPTNYYTNSNRKGLEFIYLTSNSISWKLSDKTIDELESIAGSTIGQAFIHKV